ncbi:MAG TPA: PASTA domain-containing protein [Bacteroidia bacterium]|nr:PASTA domain-containing protein [Bacteroidia bacterium]
MKDVTAFFRSKLFLINLAIAAAVISAIFWFTYLWLDNYTKHGENISVPDLRGMKVKQVDSLVSNLHLQFAVVDSVYLPDYSRGTIVEQDPLPRANVKEHRTIYLTVNSGIPPKVQMPNLIDVSLRQAEAILQTYGLMVGEFSYRHDLAKNAVLEQKFRGRDIKPGTLISRGSIINLVLGDGIGAGKVEVPSLIGLTKSEALFVLKGSSLNAGAVIFDETVRDSANAIIYKQFPLPSDSATVNEGETIDIYLTHKTSKIPD